MFNNASVIIDQFEGRRLVSHASKLGETHLNGMNYNSIQKLLDSTSNDKGSIFTYICVSYRSLRNQYEVPERKIC